MCRSGLLRRGCGVLLPALLVLGVWTLPTAATEPDGHVRLDAAWIESQGAAPHPFRRALRIDVRALVAIDDVTLTVRSPSDVPVRPLGPTALAELHPVEAAPGLRAVETHLGGLAAQSARGLELELDLPTHGGVVISFVVQGRGPSGARFREALGFSVRAGEPGTRRLGAVEFPATVRIPGETR